MRTIMTIIAAKRPKNDFVVRMIMTVVVKGHYRMF